MEQVENIYQLWQIAFNMLNYSWYVFSNKLLINPSLDIIWWDNADDETFLKGVKTD